MTAKTEDLIDRYLEAVAAQLAVEEREDIIAELRDLILSRIEAREAERGRALDEVEREAIMKDIGHPLVVAARYRKGPDSLIGPALFPYWMFAVRAGMLILLAVHGLSLAIHLIGGASDPGQAIAQAFHGLFAAGLTLVGMATVAGAVMEHYAIRPKWLTDWRVRDLGAFSLSDPANWGMAARSAGERIRSREDRRGLARMRPGNAVGDAAFRFIAIGLFLLWWIGAVHFPGLGMIRLDGAIVRITAAPIWSLLFWPILGYGLAHMGVAAFTVIQPQARRVRAILTIVMAAFGLSLAWTIFQAGDWFTLSAGGETARVAGDMTMLSFDRLRAIGDGPRDLFRTASTLSLLATWWLAITGFSLVWRMIGALGRLVQGEQATGEQATGDRATGDRAMG